MAATLIGMRSAAMRLRIWHPSRASVCCLVQSHTWLGGELPDRG